MADGARLARLLPSATATARMKANMEAGTSATQSLRSVCASLPCATSGAEYFTTMRPSARVVYVTAPARAAETLASPSACCARSSMIALKASCNERTVGSVACAFFAMASAARSKSTDIAAPVLLEPSAPFASGSWSMTSALVSAARNCAERRLRTAASSVAASAWRRFFAFVFDTDGTTSVVFIAGAMTDAPSALASTSSGAQPLASRNEIKSLSRTPKSAIDVDKCRASSARGGNPHEMTYASIDESARRCAILACIADAVVFPPFGSVKLFTTPESFGSRMRKFHGSARASPSCSSPPTMVSTRCCFIAFSDMSRTLASMASRIWRRSSISNFLYIEPSVRPPPTLSRLASARSSRSKCSRTACARCSAAASAALEDTSCNRSKILRLESASVATVGATSARSPSSSSGVSLAFFFPRNSVCTSSNVSSAVPRIASTYTRTSSFCPMRCARDTTCASSEAFDNGSINTTTLAKLKSNPSADF
mmetsp:Transcript_8435/g.27923  ORF Transcript_8435/g.27923 Transcript_8435/m.27923 type:complete len:485 (-) Transcript_8435:3766-5220(-)